MRFVLPGACVALAALVFTAAIPAAAAPSSWRGVAVRVDVFEADGTVHKRATRTVAWQDTVRMRVAVGGHEHNLAVTPFERKRGLQLSVDHSRDGTTLADDSQVVSESRRVVIQDGESRVVITISPIRSQVETLP